MGRRADRYGRDLSGPHCGKAIQRGRLQLKISLSQYYKRHSGHAAKLAFLLDGIATLRGAAADVGVALLAY